MMQPLKGEETMKRIVFVIILFLFPLIGKTDYPMMCTFENNPIARIYSVSDEGDIIFENNLEVGGNPITICFSPNGKWGMIGSNTTYYPPTQKTIILGIDSNRDISVLGTVHNEHYDLVSISSDSRYGIFGNYLQTVIFNNSDNTFYTNTENNTFYASFYADFSSLNQKIISRRTFCLIKEYEINSNGRVVETGESMDISPSSGNEDLRISPDGKTCIILSIGEYNITVLRIHEGGGFSLVQRFNTESFNPQEVRFTPDSRYAVVSFSTGYPDLRIYRINWDSTLTRKQIISIFRMNRVKTWLSHRMGNMLSHVLL